MKVPIFYYIDQDYLTLFFCVESDFVIYVNSGVTCNTYLRYIADLSAKGKSTLDKLEDTRIEMRNMQSNFAEQESQWREKNSCLAVELEIKDKKIATIEDSLNRMEKVRLRYFPLCTI